MEDFLIMLGIGIVIGIPAAIIVLLVWVTKLSKRVNTLEMRFRGLKVSQPVAAQEKAAPEPAPEPEARAPATAAPVPKPEKTRPAAAATSGPWQAAQDGEFPPEPPAPPEQRKPYTPPRAVVLRAEKAAELANWLKANWIYLVSAVSLALAGIFLVQYGIEKGYLTPVARVLGALAFGGALVAAGEYIRRRWGDGEDSPTAYLPSIFSGAGIITLFAAVLAALHFYALIGPGLALLSLAAVAVLAIVLGWFSGPLLAAVGITGAAAAPFLVGGESQTPEMFYGYYALIALIGLAIDAVRRWAWVSLLTLVLVYGAAWMLYSEIGHPEWMMALMTGLVLASIAIPLRSLFPSHTGAAIWESFAHNRTRGWPDYPTRLAAGAMAASVAVITLLSLDEPASFWLALILLSVLFAAIAVWARKARALEDLALLPVIGVLALPVLQDVSYGEVDEAFRASIDAEPGTPMPRTVFYLAGLATLISLVAAWRSLAGARWPLAWAAGAATTAPLMMVGLEVYWQPADVIGAYPWALCAAALAIVMGLLTGPFLKADGDDKNRVALFTLAALAMISFAFIIVLSETALTLALAVTVLAATALDRRFDMKALMWFVAPGVVVLGWRLMIWPGLHWAENADYLDLIAGYGGTIALLVATLALLHTRFRDKAIILTESAVWSLLAVFGAVMTYRLVEDLTGDGIDSHWGMGLLALVWFVSAANQIWRAQIDDALRRVRWVLAVIYGLIGLFFMALALTLLNPLSGFGGDVRGPVIINTLFVAYALPALLFAGLAWKGAFLDRRLRIALAVMAAALGALWLALDIRHFWHGPRLDRGGVTQPELYSYTIAMLVTGAALLYQAIASGSDTLRRIAMAVIALTVAKVFLMDITGLKGLMRVFSFLALGLVLAGLALLNRWAAAQQRELHEAGQDDA